MIGSLSGIISILGCYYLAQYYHHEKPFPQSTISATADHYPEYILFRIGTISGAALLALSYFVNHFWIRTVGIENGFRVNKYKPQISLILGTMGAFLLMGSTANLNTGKHNTHWHESCAKSFFFLSIFGNVYNSFVIGMLAYNKLKGVSKMSAILKIILAILTLVQMNEALNTSDHLKSNFL